MLLALESRTLLLTLTVSNTSDSGPNSLRAAIGQANADKQPDTIVFSSLVNTPQTHQPAPRPPWRLRWRNAHYAPAAGQPRDRRR
jgi:hypothetical protein